MKVIDFCIVDGDGLHLRPAGELVAECRGYASEVFLEYQGKQADLKRIFAVLKLNVGPWEPARISVSGSSEAEDARQLLSYMEEQFETFELMFDGR